MPEYKVRNMIILDKDIQKEIKIGDDKFIIRAILPIQERAIEEQIARWTNGVPLSSFSDNAIASFRVNATVDFCIEKGPDWWENSMSCIDNETVTTLYKKIVDWDTEFQSALKKNRFVKRSEKTEVSD